MAFAVGENIHLDKVMPREVRQIGSEAPHVAKAVWRLALGSGAGGIERDFQQRNPVVREYARDLLERFVILRYLLDYMLNQHELRGDILKSREIA